MKIIQNLKVSFSGTLHPFQMLSGHVLVVPVLDCAELNTRFILGLAKLGTRHTDTCAHPEPFREMFSPNTMGKMPLIKRSFL